MGGRVHIAERDMAELWRRFEAAEPLGLENAKALLKQSEEALPYLISRKDHVGWAIVKETHLAKMRLEEIIRELEKRKKEQEAGSKEG